MVTKGEFEYRKEQKQQVLNDLDLKILDNKIVAKKNDVKVSEIDIKRSEFRVLNAQENLKQDGLNLVINREKTAQLTDTANFEKSMTRINREKLLVQGNQAMLQLSQAKAELAENQALFQLKFKPSSSINVNRLP